MIDLIITCTKMKGIYAVDVHSNIAVIAS